MSDFIQSLKIIHNRQGKITGYESKQTTHYSIVDAQGNLSATTTLNDNMVLKFTVMN
jgi:gamma-glutamyltranspeptidase/glutathione hydrolase